MARWDVMGWVQQGMGKMALEASCYVMQHGAPLYAVMSDATARPWLKDLGRILKQDVAPMFVANYLNYLAQDAYKEDQDPATEAMLYGMNILVYGYTKLKLVQFVVHASGLALVAGKQITTDTNDNNARYKLICAECTTMRVIKGNVLDIFGYWSTELLTAYVIAPNFGGFPAALVSGYNSGRYVYTMITPMCNRHQMQNMQQSQALTIAMGISHWFLTALFTAAIHLLTKLVGDIYRASWNADSTINTAIPPEYYSARIAQLCVVLEMLIAAKIRWPDPVVQASQGFFDPVIAYQCLIRFQVETYFYGLKRTLPPLLKGTPNTDLWTRIENTAEHVSQMAYENTLNHPWRQAFLALEVWRSPLWENHLVQDALLLSAKGLKKGVVVVVPPIFYDKQAWFDDFVLGATLEQLRQDGIDTISNLEARRKELLVQWVLWLASKAPKMSAYLASSFTGMPDVVAELLIKALNSESFMRRLVQLRRTLEGPQPQSLPVLSPEAKTFLAVDEEEDNVFEDLASKEAQPRTVEAAQAIIRGDLPQVDILSPRVVEGRRAFGLFPEGLVRRRTRTSTFASTSTVLSDWEEAMRESPPSSPAH
jgi:hypothetical protein